MLNWTATIWPVAAAAAIKSTVVLAAAWLTALALRKRSAASRHIVWTACAAALLALPFLSVSMPALRLPIAAAILPGDPGLVFQSTAAAPHSAPAADVVTSARVSASSDAPHPAPTDWRTPILLLWAAGAAAVLFQMLRACLTLRRIRRAARPCPDTRQAALLAHSLGIQTPVRLLETNDGMPMTFGLLRPTVLMPAAAAKWTESRRRIVLLHELAHVQRGDAGLHLLARTALALYWWHPLAWRAWNEFLKERERAADDLVLESGAGRSEYAGHLLEVARTMQPSPAAAAAIAMARPSQLEGRLLAILADGVNRRRAGRGAALIAAIAAVAIVLPLAAIRAQNSSAPQVPPEVDATIRAAIAQKNHLLVDEPARIYEEQRKFPEALALREASLTIREQESGKFSAQYAEGLVKLGDLLRQRGPGTEAYAYYKQAVDLGDRPEVLPALMQLGLRAFKQQNPELAFDYLRRARNVSDNGNSLGNVMTWTAYLKSLTPDGAAEADSLYRSAMAAEDVTSPEQALTLELYAQFLKTQGRDGDAEPLQTRATDIRKSLAATIGPKRLLALTAMRVGGPISAPRLLSKVEPAYSEEARMAKIAGVAKLKVVIDVDGLAKDMQVVQSLGYGLDEKAVQAVTKWTFKPGAIGEVPVPVEAMIEINFKLL